MKINDHRLMTWIGCCNLRCVGHLRSDLRLISANFCNSRSQTESSLLYISQQSDSHQLLPSPSSHYFYPAGCHLVLRDLSHWIQGIRRIYSQILSTSGQSGESIFIKCIAPTYMQGSPPAGRSGLISGRSGPGICGIASAGSKQEQKYYHH